MTVTHEGRVFAGVVLVVAAFVLTACGGGDSSPKTISAPGPWDLVALGGSMPAAYGVEPKDAYTRVYAALLAEEQGIRVRVLDHSHIGWREFADWIELLANDESLRSDLAKAEIVTVFDGTHDIGLALTEECSGDWPERKACYQDATASIPDEIERLLAAIRTLVPEQAIILWGYDGAIWPPAWDDWSDEPYWPEMKQILFDSWLPGLKAAAEEHRAIVIGFKAAVSRPNGEPTPELRGFEQADGVHFTAEGHRFLAELHLAQDGLGER